MALLSDQPWKTKYTLEDGDLVRLFYVPALACAVRYDRSTGYFSASALALAMRGLEGLIANGGRMRLLVGCTLAPGEVAAIAKGEELRDVVSQALLREPLVPPDERAAEALELLAWMVAKGHLEVKVAVPCDAQRRPVAGLAIYHEKAGVLEDKTGDRIAFAGSINETPQGWRQNWEGFHVFTSWGGGADHVEAEEQTFQALWADRSKAALVVDVPTAVREALLKYLPPDDAPPQRLEVREEPADYPVTPRPLRPVEPLPEVDSRRLVWGFIHQAATLPDGGEWVGTATSAVTPWPHQIHAFRRMYEAWPPHLLIADEVGLGKTIQAGMLLRQAWLAGRARRILVLAPKAVLRQWQVELREKFNLNWPIYDGQRLAWYPSPGFQGEPVRTVARDAWHREPTIITSSHLMRRRDRMKELLEDAEPWDLVVLDEAHHARRRSGGTAADDRPNQLLRLMQALRARTQGLVLLTATPMQVSPIEVWDLLALLGLPPAWHVQAFLEFFETAAKASPGHEDLARMARLFQVIEQAYGEVRLDEARRFVPGQSLIKAKKILKALRERSSIPLRQLETDERRAAVALMRANTPIRRLISRHTRALLRRYFQAGQLQTPIAERAVEDRFVPLTPAEREVYEAVEDYISSTYHNAAEDERTAVGFVMTIYRRRLASSFQALAETLRSRLTAVRAEAGPATPVQRDLSEDVSDDELEEEILDPDEVAELERQTLAREEDAAIEGLLASVRALPPDSKVETLIEVLRELRAAGYHQAIVFTQYTDTLDFLREHVARELAVPVLCFSGRGGEVRQPDGTWQVISREDTKRRFRAGAADIMVCTDAAAEGLNFQFCGALVNYDMPWNPMRVEQRIGRIDRLGQDHPTIRIVNLHYADTVEADVYDALRHRIQLFQSFVGQLQPILARLPKAIADTALQGRAERERTRHELVSHLNTAVDEAQSGGFDLNEVTGADIEAPTLPPAALTLPDLHAVLRTSTLLPPGVEAKKVGKKDYAFLQPGMPRPIRVTTDPDFYDAHSDSVELWSPGSPLFPQVEGHTAEPVVSVEAFRATLVGQTKG